MTPQEAATEARVSRGLIMKAISSGELVAVRENAGNKWNIQKSDLDDWLAQRAPKRRKFPTGMTVTPKAPDSVVTALKHHENSDMTVILKVSLEKMEALYKDIAERDRAQITKLEAASERDRDTIQKLRDELAAEKGRGLFSRLWGR